MKAFGTRPTYRIFAVMTLLTGIMYFIFNITYLRKRSRLEDDDLEKSKDAQNSFGKHANDIGLNEKPQDEQIKEDKENASMRKKNEFSEKIRESDKLSKGTNEQSLTRIETVRNAKNADAQNRRTRGHKRDESATGDDTKVEESAAQETNCFTNQTFETDNSDRRETVEENQQMDDKLTDREHNSQL